MATLNDKSHELFFILGTLVSATPGEQAKIERKV
jgi:hypothetical protein